jgi:hypothetical protein
MPPFEILEISPEGDKLGVYKIFLNKEKINKKETKAR